MKEFSGVKVDGDSRALGELLNHSTARVSGGEEHFKSMQEANCHSTMSEKRQSDRQ